MKVSERIMNAEDVRTILLQRGIAVSRRSTLILVVLSVAKVTVSLLSGSIALLADAAHTIMDDLNRRSFSFDVCG